MSSRFGQPHPGVFPKGQLGGGAAPEPDAAGMHTAPPHVVPPLIPATQEQQRVGSEPLLSRVPDLGQVPAAAYLAGAALVFWFVSNGTARMRSGV